MKFIQITDCDRIQHMINIDHIQCISIMNNYREKAFFVRFLLVSGLEIFSKNFDTPESAKSFLRDKFFNLKGIENG